MSASGVDIRPVTGAAVEYVARHIREEDRVEVYESSRRDPLMALQQSVKKSERSAGVYVDDEPVAICGVGRLNLMSEIGVPWMIGTDVLRRNAKVLLPHAPKVVRKMMQGHEVLRNLVHEENKASKRWLRSMGFNIGNPEISGWRGAKFHVFEMYRSELDV